MLMGSEFQIWRAEILRLFLYRNLLETQNMTLCSQFNKYITTLQQIATANAIRHRVAWVGPNKLDCFSEIITLQKLVAEKRVACQNFLN